MEGIICSMTPLERRKPELIKASRKRRIAAGAGVQVQEVNRLLNQFEQMQGMMKKMKGGGLMKMMKRMGGMGARHDRTAGRWRPRGRWKRNGRSPRARAFGLHGRPGNLGATR
jgi:signal recognition particle GTPase